jgi:hypothetical protein
LNWLLLLRVLSGLWSCTCAGAVSVAAANNILQAVWL